MISGQITAYATKKGKRIKLGDTMRGESVGELAMFTGDPRMADVITARNSTLARLGKGEFNQTLLVVLTFKSIPGT